MGADGFFILCIKMGADGFSEKVMALLFAITFEKSNEWITKVMEKVIDFEASTEKKRVGEICHTTVWSCS